MENYEILKIIRAKEEEILKATIENVQDKNKTPMERVEEGSRLLFAQNILSSLMHDFIIEFDKTRDYKVFNEKGEIADEK